MDWRHRAACQVEDPELFFPTSVPDTPAWAYQVARAQAVCARCPVVVECRQFALVLGASGVWGGEPMGDTRSRQAQHPSQVGAWVS